MSARRAKEVQTLVEATLGSLKKSQDLLDRIKEADTRMNARLANVFRSVDEIHRSLKARE